jgi:hypothetical protein
MNIKSTYKEQNIITNCEYISQGKNSTESVLWQGYHGYLLVVPGYARTQSPYIGDEFKYKFNKFPPKEICFFTTIFRKKYKEVSLQSVTPKKGQVLSRTFLQSDWFIFSLSDMLASAPLSELFFTMAHQPIRLRDYRQLW